MCRSEDIHVHSTCCLTPPPPHTHSMPVFLWFIWTCTRQKVDTNSFFCLLCINVWNSINSVCVCVFCAADCENVLNESSEWQELRFNFCGDDKPEAGTLCPLLLLECVVCALFTFLNVLCESILSFKKIELKVGLLVVCCHSACCRILHLRLWPKLVCQNPLLSEGDPFNFSGRTSGGTLKPSGFVSRSLNP